MPFAVKHRSRARSELNACASRLGPEFLASVEAWLRDLANEAERGEESLSDDARAFLERVGPGQPIGIPETGLSRWIAAGCREKVVAFLIWLKERRDAWEFRMAIQVFMVPNLISDRPPQSPGVVLILYEVDRVNRRIVVTHYPELPCPA